MATGRNLTEVAIYKTSPGRAPREDEKSPVVYDPIERAVEGITRVVELKKSDTNPTTKDGTVAYFRQHRQLLMPQSKKLKVTIYHDRQQIDIVVSEWPIEKTSDQIDVTKFKTFLKRSLRTHPLAFVERFNEVKKDGNFPKEKDMVAGLAYYRKLSPFDAPETGESQSDSAILCYSTILYHGPAEVRYRNPFTRLVHIRHIELRDYLWEYHSLEGPFGHQHGIETRNALNQLGRLLHPEREGQEKKLDDLVSEFNHAIAIEALKPSSNPDWGAILRPIYEIERLATEQLSQSGAAEDNRGSKLFKAAMALVGSVAAGFLTHVLSHAATLGSMATIFKGTLIASFPFGVFIGLAVFAVVGSAMAGYHLWYARPPVAKTLADQGQASELGIFGKAKALADTVFDAAKSIPEAKAEVARVREASAPRPA